MTLQIKLYIAVATLAAAAFAVTAAVSAVRISRLESSVTAARAAADETARAAAESEKKAAEFRQKEEYLESEVSDLQQLQRRQDEKIKTTADTSRVARIDADRAGRVRSVDTDLGQLCDKLAAVGHGCR